MRVLIDDQAFVRHGRSGITRYFTELIREFRSDGALIHDGDHALSLRRQRPYQRHGPAPV